jgi:acetoin utilization deacetylase AcuC-like enzyme
VGISRLGKPGAEFTGSPAALPGEPGLARGGPLADSRRSRHRAEATMTTLLLTHDACLAHDPGPGHPESPARLRAVRAALDAPAFAALARAEAPRASLDDVALVHPRTHAERILAAVPGSGRQALDADTALSPGSGEAALRAAGAVVAAVDAVAQGRARNAFCAVRPPGHHAEAALAMGFCLFNNAAIGAARARVAHGLHRVAVVDFDVHHGNGTQAILEGDAGFFFASTHQMPLYPGTGDPAERGVAGNVVNVALRPHADGTDFRRAMERLVLPALDAFAPQFVLISAGFDAHRRDPLAALDLEAEDFAWATAAIAAIADRHAGGRLVATLEGGYDLAALAESAAAHVTALMAA